MKVIRNEKIKVGHANYETAHPWLVVMESGTLIKGFQFRNEALAYMEHVRKYGSY